MPRRSKRLLKPPSSPLPTPSILSAGAISVAVRDSSTMASSLCDSSPVSGTGNSLPASPQIGSSSRLHSRSRPRHHHPKRSRSNELLDLLQLKAQLNRHIRAHVDSESDQSESPTRAVSRASPTPTKRRKHSPSILEVYEGTKSRNVQLPRHVRDRSVIPRSDHSPRRSDNDIDLLAVSSEMVSKLMDLRVYFDITELLPSNREIDPSIIRRRPEQQDTKREFITSFLAWSRAFYVFASYRGHYFPDLRQHLWDYFDLIAQMSERTELAVWVTYDTKFRLFASRHTHDHSIWSVRHPKSYEEAQPQLPITARLGYPFPPTLPARFPLGTCYTCGDPSHLSPRCPFNNRPPFRGNTSTDEVCRNFNDDEAVRSERQ
ncbi:hypothetical protein BV898_18853 [Hypsibius exemplaris]|uniref:CCHC-type domain-containing protein n=1 Tax=Hypsibius exemplaris TaxID=2072580 RepID=A0A9X6NKD8_HYPEX|nr:hypothetical protein BV898_18853 [Hypsibius exemplaris]